MRRLALLTALLAGALCAAPARAQQLVPFGGQSYASPYYVTGEPGNPNRVYVVEAAGRIRVVVNGATEAGSLLDINADVCDSGEGCGGESGMFSMALAPDYAGSGLLYVFYTRDDPTPGNEHDLVIREFQRTASPNDIEESTGRDVLVIPHPSASNHNGGQLQFGPDGLLYISTGDGGNTPALAQDLTTLLGKLLRIDPADPPGMATYSIPAGNPFADGAGPNADEIYSYGLRNPYRFSFDRLTGDLIIADVGQSEWEEIDFVAHGGGLGANFGWRCFEGTEVFTMSAECNPLPSNHTPPVHQYLNPPGSGAAINGGYVVRDTTVPSLLGRYLYADSVGAFPEIRSVALFPGGASGDAATALAGGTSSFGEDACGHVYVAHFGGTVSRIQQSPAEPACAPQLALPPPPPQPPPAAPAASAATATGDIRAPSLSVRTGKAKRAAARGRVTLVVGCDEACNVRGHGKLKVPGKNIVLSPDSTVLGAGEIGALQLELSRRQARRLRGVLRKGRRSKAVVRVTAADATGNQGVERRRIRQKKR
jgi:glucose/arabinose dehydrogenase